MKRNACLPLMGLAFLLYFPVHSQGSTVESVQTPFLSIFDPAWKRPIIISEGPQKVLGLTLKEAVGKFGLPDSLHSVRGPEEWQDDAVFRYDDGYEFYWYRDRIWQVRLGKGYAGPVSGVYVGESQDKLPSLFGTPEFGNDAYMVFRLPDQGYPVRLRAVCQEGKIMELYVFRGDF